MSNTPKPSAPNNSAERKRRYRARMAAGKIVIPIEISDVAALEMLIAKHLLSPADQDDRSAIGRALSKLVELISSEDAGRVPSRPRDMR